MPRPKALSTACWRLSTPAAGGSQSFLPQFLARRGRLRAQRAGVAPQRPAAGQALRRCACPERGRAPAGRRVWVGAARDQSPDYYVALLSTTPLIAAPTRTSRASAAESVRALVLVASTTMMTLSIWDANRLASAASSSAGLSTSTTSACCRRLARSCAIRGELAKEAALPLGLP